MEQLWILSAELGPLEAIRQDANQGVCGTCPLQGEFDPTVGKMVGRVCYVNLGQAPLSIWNAFQRGTYPPCKQALHEPYLQSRDIRLGAYGDPAASLWIIWPPLARDGRGTLTKRSGSMQNVPSESRATAWYRATTWPSIMKRKGGAGERS